MKKPLLSNVFFVFCFICFTVLFNSFHCCVEVIYLLKRFHWPSLWRTMSAAKASPQPLLSPCCYHTLEREKKIKASIKCIPLISICKGDVTIHLHLTQVIILTFFIKLWPNEGHMNVALVHNVCTVWLHDISEKLF